MLKTIKTLSKPCIYFAFSILSVFIFYWMSMQMYSQFCIPKGVYGLIETFFTLGSPVCQFLNYVQYNLSTQYVKIWGAAGIALIGWSVAKLK